MTISASDFKDALRHFPAGVTLVTAGRDNDIRGLTVSAFASVSAEPPMIAVILDLKSQIHPYLVEDGAAFGVNFLGTEHRELSDRFAFGDRETRFEVGDWGPAPSGVPVLGDALVWLDCTVATRLEAGSHVIYVGEVQASNVRSNEGTPLVYWNRAYRQLATQVADEGE